MPTKIKTLKVVLNGFNGVKHNKKLNTLRKRGWINFAVAFNADKLVTEYHLKKIL
jgi:hypothetical protein